MTEKPNDIIPEKLAYDVDDHYDAALTLFDAYPLKTEQDREAHALLICNEALKSAGVRLDSISEAFSAAICSTIETTLDTNNFIQARPPYHVLARYYLQEQEYLLSEERLAIATKTLIDLFASLLPLFPATFLTWTYTEDNSGIPLISLLPNPERIIEAVAVTFIDCNVDRYGEKLAAFPTLKARLADNVLRANGLTTESNSKKKIRFPSEFDLEPTESVNLFLNDTAFQFLFNIGIAIEEPQMPAPPDALKFEHTWCLAGSGAGKTTLILREIVENLRRDNPPAMIVIDPKGTITDQLSRLAVFDPASGKHKDRLLIIDPSDVTTPPALNMFHPGDAKRFRMYSEAQRRQVENRTIDLFSYVFGSRGQKLTPQQSTTFNYLARLLFSIEGATIHTMLDLINDQLYDRHASVDNSKWKPFIERQQPIAQRWFRDQYFNHLVETRKGVATRLYGILEKPEIEAAFSSKERKLDMFDALQTGKTVLINAPKALLGEGGMELFGRYMIALTLASAFERVTVPDRRRWHPAFIFVDEFQEFADDEKSAELFQLAREFNLGVFVAHQDIASQISEKLSSALSANTAIKYASAIGGKDTSFMAREMNTEPAFFQRAVKTTSEGRFACYIRGVTPTAGIVAFPFGAIGREPRMSDASYELLLRLNRSRLTESRGDHTLGVASMPKQSAPDTPSQDRPETNVALGTPSIAPPARDPGEPADSW